MMDVGLHPSETGRPGGKTIGQRMSHYVISGGPFDRASRKLLAKGFDVAWAEAMTQKIASSMTPSPEKAGRVRWGCPNCKLKAWAKPTALLVCGECNKRRGVCTVERTWSRPRYRLTRSRRLARHAADWRCSPRGRHYNICALRTKSALTGCCIGIEARSFRLIRTSGLSPFLISRSDPDRKQESSLMAMREVTSEMVQSRAKK